MKLIRNSRVLGAVLKLGLLTFLVGCAQLSSLFEKTQERDLQASPEITGPREVLANHLLKAKKKNLKDVVEEKYLKVLTSRNSFDYFLGRNGLPQGYQYEMVREVVKHLNKKYNPKKKDLKIQFEMLPVYTDQVISLLNKGMGEFAAVAMPITPELKKEVHFSRPWNFLGVRVITHLDPRAFDSLEKLAGRKFALKGSSGLNQTLDNLNKILDQKDLDPIKVIRVSEALETENIIEMVANKKYDFTMAETHFAELGKKIFPKINIVPKLNLGKKFPVGWVFRKDTPQLLKTVNSLIPKIKKGTLLGNVLFLKYFKNYKKLKFRLNSKKGNKISKYDKIIQKFSKQYGIDWRIASSLCYQESRFTQNIVNEWGAIGLFQVKQMTADEPYVRIRNITGPKNYRNNIHAGIKYLTWIKKTYFNKNKNMRERDRLRMAMGAYNAGPTTILRAIRRAQRMNLNPNRWFRNVELALMDMRKYEPVKYVSEINKRFISYVILGVSE